MEEPLLPSLPNQEKEIPEDDQPDNGNENEIHADEGNAVRILTAHTRLAPFNPEVRRVFRDGTPMDLRTLLPANPICVELFQLLRQELR